jgi:hypothetical protein
MGELHTTKKRRRKKNQNLLDRATNQAAAETITEVMAHFLEKWTKKELATLALNNQFICIDVGRDLYRVGRFNLQRQAEKRWIVMDMTGKIIHEFYNKQAAVFYCLYESKHMFHKAHQFLYSDLELGRTYLQVTEYLAQLRLAQQRKDSFKVDLYLARLSFSQPKLELLETNLQKTIISAKYSKVWETNNHETARTRY